ncbi:hypothetical protein B566_EDAN002050 [Ephemera danica]|nr:hypothetical protein B566_EDAN002050 [Ephemera danica]
MAQLLQTVFSRVIVGVVVLQLLLILSETRIAEVTQDNGLPYHTWDVTQWLEHLDLEIIQDNTECEHAKRVYREGFLVANITASLLRQRMLEQNHWVEEQRSQLKACLARELEMRHLLFQQCYQTNSSAMNLLVTELGQSLIYESRAGNVETVKSLINAGVSVSVKDKDGWTPLLVATCNNKASIVKLLLQSGADPNIKNRFGDTNLVWAAHNDNVEMAKMLREKGATLDYHGQTALHFAAYRGGVNIIRYFLSIGADINAKDSSGMTPLKHAIGNNKTIIAEFLRSQGATE